MIDLLLNAAPWTFLAMVGYAIVIMVRGHIGRQ